MAEPVSSPPILAAVAFTPDDYFADEVDKRLEKSRITPDAVASST